MHSNYTNKLLNLKGVFIKNIIQADSFIQIHLRSKPREHTYPNCGSLTKLIHDYRDQQIKEIPIHGKHVLLILNKRRYKCDCGKHFYEYNDFLPRYHRMTNQSY